MTAFVFGIFGLIIGSFLNVLILRHGERGLGGRSGCMSCGRTLSWYDMIPVFSWALLGGKCRTCKARISIQYPLVEAATGILFALIGASSLPLASQLVGCAITAFFIAIVVYDLYHTIIPDPWVYSVAILAFVSQFLTPMPEGIPWLQFLLAGPVVALPLFALWLFSRGSWMGFGDVKLALGIGWLLGPLYGTVALFFAFVIGAVVSVCILLPLPHILAVLSKLGITPLALRQGGFTIHSEIPFGPFLITSTLIVWFMLIYKIDPLVFVGLSFR